MSQNRSPDFGEVGADEQTELTTTTPNSRTEGERWLEAYRRDAVRWMLQAISEAAAEGAEAEPDIPLWPEPGTPERVRLDRRNAAICTGLREGFERHRAALCSAVPPSARTSDICDKPRDRLAAEDASETIHQRGLYDG